MRRMPTSVTPDMGARIARPARVREPIASGGRDATDPTALVPKSWASASIWRSYRHLCNAQYEAKAEGAGPRGPAPSRLLSGQRLQRGAARVTCCIAKLFLDADELVVLG